MKVLLFTHKSDIDGMGNVILAKLAFQDVEYVLCETFNLQNEIEKYYENKEIYNFDKVFVTDLWLEEPMLTKVAKDEKLKNKFFVFDHHKSALEGGYNQYSFAKIQIENEKGLCCGTSLFYEYLVSQEKLDKQNKLIQEFVEKTRRYDTWEWKTIYEDEMAHELTLLFDSVGCTGYIKMLYEKLKEKEYNYFFFNDLEKMLIENKKEHVKEKLKDYANKIVYKNISGLKAGIVFIDYEYRNDLAEYIREQKIDIDFVMLIALDYGTISYRNIKENINVRKIAEGFGGKGHDKAASSPISKEQQKEIQNILIGKVKI